MEKEFIPYTEAFALKELGFDEPCWCYFMGDVFNSSMFLKDYEYLDTMPQKYITYTLAPLYQQAIRFFREKYKFNQFIHPNCASYFYTLFSKDDCPTLVSDDYSTYEEAELACLRKLIEIVKKK